MAKRYYVTPEEKALLDQLMSDPANYQKRVDQLMKFQTHVQGVTPEQFITDPYYFGKTGASLWPKNKELFIEIANNRQLTIIVFTGSIGWGKGYVASALTGWYLFDFLRFKIPQMLCGLAPTSPMYATVTSVTAAHSKKSFYKEIRSMMEACPFFRDVVPYDHRLQSEIVWRSPAHGDITLVPSAPDALADIGLNLFFCLIDEWAFMENITDSKRAEFGAKTYDQARRIFENLERRLRNRTTVGGETMGKILLVSSANYEGDIVDTFIKERGKDPTVRVLDRTEIEQKPGVEQQASFYCFIGDVKKKMAPKITDTAEELSEFPPNMIKRIPQTYRAIFEGNVYAGMRDILGIRTSISAHLFPDKSKIDDCMDGMKSVYPERYNLVDVQWLVKQLLPFINLAAPYAIHLDLSKSKCDCGFAMTRCTGVLPPSENQEFNDELPDRLLLQTDVAIAIEKDPLLGEVSIPKTEELIMTLMNYDVKVVALSWDGFQSQGSEQRFRPLIKITNVIPVDRDKSVYYHMLRIVNSRRWKCNYSPTLERELKSLLDLPGSKHIEKGECGTKDVSDATGCSCFHIYMNAQEFGVGGSLDFYEAGKYNEGRTDITNVKSPQVSGERKTTVKAW